MLLFKEKKKSIHVLAVQQTWTVSHNIWEILTGAFVQSLWQKHSTLYENESNHTKEEVA